MALPIAIQLYTLRNEAKEDFAATLKKVKEMGYDGVEFAGLHGYSADEVKKMCEDNGLIPVSAHVAYDEFVADIAGVVKTYADIGCKYIAFPSLPVANRPGAEKFDETVENTKKIATEMAKYGMTLLYHNHDFEFEKMGGKYMLDILYEAIEKEYLQTELDVCWVSVGGEHSASFIKKYAGRAPVVHFKDYVGERAEDMYELIGVDRKAPPRPDGFEFRSVGAGKQDFSEILAAAIEADAKWVVVEQDRPTPGYTPLECAKMSVDHIRSL